MKDFFMNFIGWDKENEELVNMPLNYFLIIIFLISLFSFSYRVNSNEQATIWLMGKHVGIAKPGFHLKLPYPLMEVTTSPVLEMQRQEIGFRTIDVDASKYLSVPEESEMLTGDNNIADVEWINQFQIGDIKKWQYVVKNPKRLINLNSQSSMRLQVGKSTFEDILTTKKLYTQNEAYKITKNLADKIDFGVTLKSMQLQDVNPPKAVEEEFKEVETAKQQKESAIEEGHGYFNKVVPEARGNGAREINEARGRKAKMIGDAKREVSEFLKLYSEYKKYPQITKMRMRNETLQKILPGSKILYIDDSGVLKHFNLNQFNSTK